MRKLSPTWTLAALSLLLLGFHFYLLGLFLSGAHAPALDEALLLEARSWRSFSLTRFFLELTALGSASVLITLNVVLLTLLGCARRWGDFWQLLFVGLFGWGLMEALKRVVGRPRPSPDQMLDFVSGFSFPSGHSSSGAGIYLTLAILALPLVKGRRARAVWISTVCLLVFLIGLSRVYLGVHYPSDVAGGLCLGTGLACLAHIGASRLFHRSAQG